MRVLFIGNSMLYYHDLPGRVMKLARQDNRTVTVDLEAGGGADLKSHLENPRVTAKLRDPSLTHVVLQEQSTLPLEEPESFAEALSAFARLTNDIRPYLFVPFVGSFSPEKQRLLFSVSKKVASETGISVIENEKGWEILRSRYGPSLYSEDGHHPSSFGSHVHAYYLYSALCGVELKTEELFSSPLDYLEDTSPVLW